MTPRLLIPLLTLAAVLSCTKQQVQASYDKQETMIDNFVSTQLKTAGTYAVYNKGSVRLVTVKGEGTESLATDGVVSYYYALYRLTSSPISSSNLISTNNAEVAGSSWSLSDESSFDIITAKLDEADYIEGLRNGLAGVRSGQECYILFSGKYGFGDRIHGTIPANSGLVYHIWVSSISND